ncbi:MAG: homing endonuclease associated repeat-containing protein [Emergencia sp.]
MDKEKKLNEEEIRKLQHLLVSRFACSPDKEAYRSDRESSVYRTYSLSTGKGKKIYQSFSDEELLQYLRMRAGELDHPPAQKEVFWVMREYIKKRFQRWPYALKAAGLQKAAGSGGRTMEQMKQEQNRHEELLKQIREKAVELGRIPHPQDVPEICDALRRYYSQWGGVLEAAGLDSDTLNRESVYRIENLEPEYKAMLQAVKEYACSIGRSPFHYEIDPDVKKALIKRCGSWRNALYQVGLTPVVRMKAFDRTYIDHRKEENRKNHSRSLKDCFYQVLDADETVKQDLEQLRELYQKKKAPLLKDEVPAELRRRLQDACGTWANAQYQIGVRPEDYYQRVKDERRRQTPVRKKGR